MANLEERVRHLFGLAIEAKIAMADSLSADIAKACERLVQCLLNDAKILLCGNGGSAANCFHLSSLLLNHADIERPPLPVISLCADNAIMTGLVKDGQAEQVFARQIQAIGQEGDVLVVMSINGNSGNLLHALQAAHERGMDVIALNGREGGLLTNHLGPEDIELRVQADNGARVHEMHLFIINCFVDLIEQSLFGQMMGVV